jgi:hypothetical protein
MSRERFSLDYDLAPVASFGEPQLVYNGWRVVAHPPNLVASPAAIEAFNDWAMEIFGGTKEQSLLISEAYSTTRTRMSTKPSKR